MTYKLGASALALALAALGSAQAWNGAIGYATHMAPPTLDGDLSDWPEADSWMPIAYNYFHAADNDDDLSAKVRFGYNVEDGSLYVAIQVTDDTHISPQNDNWRTGDAAIVYLDTRHAQTASGVAGFVASETNLSLSVPEAGFDPAVAAADLEGVDIGMHREGHVTTYEYRFELGDQIQANRVLGVDLAVFDNDPGQQNFTANYWGPYWGKTGAAGRAGDILLVSPEEDLGTVNGRVEWHDGLQAFEGQAPIARLTSKDNPDLWVQVMGDEDANFEVQLPAGDYEISYPLAIIGGLLGPHERVDTASTAEVSVRAGQTSQTELILNRMPTPQLYENEGILFDWTEHREADLDAFIAAWMEYFAVPGLTVAVIHDNQLAYRQDYGVANYATQEPVTPETIFEAASITKIVFAFAVHRLVEQGVIDLDRPLHEYLAFEELEHDPRYLLMTGRHVLTHQTGLPNWRNGQIELAFTPGEGHQYSGEGIEYLARVVEAVTGRTIEDVLMEEVQIPMGMVDHTYFSDSQELRELVAVGHSIERPNSIRIPTRPGMAHSMHTTADDLANFALNLLKREGLEPETYNEMFDWATTAPPEPSEHDLPWQMGFGQGFGLIDAPFGMGFWHGGNNGDFMSRMEAYPEEGIGLVVMGNNERAWAMGEVIRRYLIGGSQWPSSLEVAQKGRSPGEDS